MPEEHAIIKSRSLSLTNGLSRTILSISNPTAALPSQNVPCEQTNIENFNQARMERCEGSAGQPFRKRSSSARKAFIETILGTIILAEARVDILSPLWVHRVRLRLSVAISFSAQGMGALWKAVLESSPRVADSFQLFEFIRQGDDERALAFLRDYPPSIHARDSWD